MMKMSISGNTNLHHRLFDLAELQNGYFTARQAKVVGYRYRNFGYYVSHNDWIKVAKSVYRLRNFPVSDDEQYTLWSLWVGERNGYPLGVYSYLTALSYYDLSEVIPNKLHMTVPKSFRTSKQIPKVLILHKENFDEMDIVSVRGYCVTKPHKTLLDLAKNEMMEREHFAKAVLEALKKGYISKDFVLDNPVFDIVKPYVETHILI